MVRARPVSAVEPELAEERCRGCGAGVTESQEWCLECGAARTLLRPPPDWRIPLAVVGVVIALAAAALVLTVLGVQG